MTLSKNYSQAILHTFLDIKQYTDIFREPLANNTTHFSRAYIKQYWHTESYRELTGKQYYTLFQYLYQAILRWDFQRFPSKLNYNKKLFQSSYCTILTLFQRVTIKQYWPSPKVPIPTQNHNLTQAPPV